MTGHPRLAFPAVCIDHGHPDPSMRESDPQVPDAVMELMFTEPVTREVVWGVLLAPAHARQIAAELVRQADIAESCIETHPDLKDLGL